MKTKILLFLLILLGMGGSLPAQDVLTISPAGAVQAPVDSNGWRNFKLTLTQNVTSFSFVGIPPPAQAQVTVIFAENATGGFTVAFASNISNPCTVTTTANAITACQFNYDGTTNTWLGISGSSSGSGIHSISFSIGSPGGVTIATGPIAYVTIPYACTIKSWSIQADAGTATVQFWKVATGTAVPTVANSISTAGVSLSSGTVIQSTTLTDFTTTAISANDIIAVNVGTVSGVGYINVQLNCQ